MSDDTDHETYGNSYKGGAILIAALTGVIALAHFNHATNAAEQNDPHKPDRVQIFNAHGTMVLDIMSDTPHEKYRPRDKRNFGIYVPELDKTFKQADGYKWILTRDYEPPTLAPAAP